jgi:hypothetical protein
MSGETDLDKLIKGMNPFLAPEDFAIAHVQSTADYECEKVFAWINEPEGITLILTVQQAEQWQINYDSVFSLITLQIHSSLDAVGLTAAFSTALAKHNMSANVVAGFYHDHLLVAKDDAQKAIKVLQALTER